MNDDNKNPKMFKSRALSHNERFKRYEWVTNVSYIDGGETKQKKKTLVLEEEQKKWKRKCQWNNGPGEERNDSARENESKYEEICLRSDNFLGVGEDGWPNFMNLWRGGPDAGHYHLAFPSWTTHTNTHTHTRPHIHIIVMVFPTKCICNLLPLSLFRQVKFEIIIIIIIIVWRRLGVA